MLCGKIILNLQSYAEITHDAPLWVGNFVILSLNQKPLDFESITLPLPTATLIRHLII